MKVPHLTAVIVTYNESNHITECIDSLSFADDVLVYDSFSTDNTVALAEAAGASIFQRPFDNFANQRNAALDLVEELSRQDEGARWVLFVDADERVTPALAAEVRAAIQGTTYAGWRIPRHNYIFGRLTRGAGWYPDYQTRLLRIGAARYDASVIVHEVVQLQGALGTLTEHLIHFNYTDITQFRQKQRRYADLEAQILHQRGVRPKPWTYITQPLRHFKWRYLKLHGYREGWHGFRLSALMAWYEFYKYQRLWQLRRQSG